MRNEIKTMSIDQIGVIMRDLKQPKFRAKQLYEWIHVHHCSSYDEMTNLPKALREELEANYPLYSPHIAQQQESSDGTRKYLTTLSDGNCVETVGIPAYSLEENSRGLPSASRRRSVAPWRAISAPREKKDSRAAS